MRVYEELFILKPDSPEEEVDAYIAQLKELIANAKGTVEKADKWGTRKLAYRISKYNEGIYVLIVFTSTPELVKEIERRMRVTDMVIKFITVRVDQKMKKINKRKKHRDKRASRRPAPMSPPPAMPGAGPGTPGPGVMPGAPVAHSGPAMPAAATSAPAHSPAPALAPATVPAPPEAPGADADKKE